MKTKQRFGLKETARLLDSGKTLDSHLWSFVGGKPLVGGPARCFSPESDAMSNDLLSRGFKFVGTKICYSLMQATGMVNDHLVGCWRENGVD